MASDYYDTAQAGNAATQAALLQAIATQGSNAKQAFDSAQAAIQAQKQQALASAIGEAAKRGAPGATQDQAAATIGSGYDRQLADLNASQASRAGALANVGAAGTTYLTEANAALPALRARSDLQSSNQAASLASQLASQKASADAATASGQRANDQFSMQMADRKQTQDQAAADRKAAQDYATQQAAQKQAADEQTAADQRQLQTLQLAIAQANAGKAQTTSDAAVATAQAKATKAAAPLSAAKALTTTFGSQADFVNYVDQAVKAQQAATIGGGLGALTHTPPPNPAAIADQIATQAGLAPGLGSSIYNAAAQAKAATATKAAPTVAATQRKQANGLAPTALPGYDAGAKINLSKATVDSLVRSSSNITNKTMIPAGGSKQGNPFNDAITTFDATRKNGGTLEQANSDLAAGLVSKYGHDFPQVRALVTAMYGY